jgi:hypothetical protein
MKKTLVAICLIISSLLKFQLPLKVIKAMPVKAYIEESSSGNYKPG